MEFAQHSQLALFPEILNVQNNSAILNNVPPGFENVSVEFIRDNLAVIPGEWDIADLKTTFYDLQTNESILAANLAQIKGTDFIAWDKSFFDFIGTSAAIEIILSFPGVEHVHEAPVYVPESNELLFSDTSAVGWLWAINLDTYETRNITTNPPLHNVNGGTSRNGNIYLTTNGSPVRGIYSFNPTDGTAVPVLNNYLGRHLNSPNDLVTDSKGNIWFTDPAYGWYQSWPGVQAPELPNSIYFFNTTSKALITVSNSVVLVPNGLAFSEDESILYVTDSNSTSGRPLQDFQASQRNIWAFDVSGTRISNPRLVYVTEAGWPDGIRVTSNGFLIVTVFGGADVVDPKSGLLLGRINTPGDIIFNVEPIPGTGTWFLTGQNHIYKVTLAEKALLR